MPIFFPRKAIIFPLNLVLNIQHTISYQPSRKDHEELEQFMSSETHHEAYDIYACRFSWKTIKFFFQWSQTDSKVANLMLWKNIYIDTYAFEWLTQSMKIFHSWANAIHSTYYHFNCWDYIESIAHSYAKNADVAQIARGLVFEFYIKDKKFCY